MSSADNSISVALLCIKWYCWHYSNDWGATHSWISPFWIRGSVIFNSLLLRMAVSRLLVSNSRKSFIRRHSTESQTTWIFINTPVRTSDLSVAITMWLQNSAHFLWNVTATTKQNQNSKPLNTWSSVLRGHTFYSMHLPTTILKETPFKIPVTTSICLKDKYMYIQQRYQNIIRIPKM